MQMTFPISFMTIWKLFGVDNMSYYQCKIRDAKSIDNKHRWVDCQIIKGVISDLDKTTGSVLVELKRAYYNPQTKEVYEKINQELMLYKRDFRNKKV